MNKKIKKIIFWLSVCVLTIMPFFQASAVTKPVTLFLPNTTWQEDVNIDNTQINTNESNIFRYIQIINGYLWFTIAWIAMAALIYAWIMMITAWWDKSKVGKAWKLALSCIIAIVVAMLSWLLVKLIIWLF